MWWPGESDQCLVFSSLRVIFAWDLQLRGVRKKISAFCETTCGWSMLIIPLLRQGIGEVSQSQSPHQPAWSKACFVQFRCVRLKQTQRFVKNNQNHLVLWRTKCRAAFLYVAISSCTRISFFFLVYSWSNSNMYILIQIPLQELFPKRELLKKSHCCKAFSAVGKGLASFSSWLTCRTEEDAKERKEKQVLCWAGHYETFLVVFSCVLLGHFVVWWCLVLVYIGVVFFLPSIE